MGQFYADRMVVDDLFVQSPMDGSQVCLLKCRRSAFQVGQSMAKPKLAEQRAGL